MLSAVSRAACGAFAFALAGAALAQSNVIPGRDLRLQDTFGIDRFRRTGTYPNGVQAIGTWTIVCNPGTSDIPFLAPMNPLHAFIHYMVVRESDGRLVQISNDAWVKHTFGSSNDPSPCGNCPGPGITSFVVQGCNDTYANDQAVDHFNLGPPSEVDPWLGTWNPVCSLFDRGNPPVAPALQCDGVRSLDIAQAGVLNQQIGDAMRVYDDDLAVPGATFCYQSGYLIPFEADALRGDNLGSRQFSATWNPGTQEWDLADSSSFLAGTVLQRWTGAAIDSNSNGNDDGRFYVAVKVTGPVDGRYHYEYAVHNRDNLRGMGALRIPVCDEAQVGGFGFRDFDRQPLTDWSGAVVGNEIVFQVNTLHASPLRWNCIFNFWFDCDAAPLPGAVLLDQYEVGPGALTVSVPSSAPIGLWNQSLGAGCGSPQAPALHGVGAPDRAAIPNATFALRSTGNPAGAPCAFVLSAVPGSVALGGGCVAWTGDLLSLIGPLATVADASGATTLGLAVPNNPALEGQAFDFQMMNIAPAGALLGVFDLSNGLRVRVGNLIAGCP